MCTSEFTIPLSSLLELLLRHGEILIFYVEGDVCAFEFIIFIIIFAWTIGKAGSLSLFTIAWKTNLINHKLYVYTKTNIYTGINKKFRN